MACGQGRPWVCEHRWPSIAGMVKWRQVAGTVRVANWVNDGDGHIAFSRGTNAFVAFSSPSSGVWRATLQTGLPPGTYCDVAAGAAAVGARKPTDCAEVHVRGDGTADVAVGESGSPVVALHVKRIRD